MKEKSEEYYNKLLHDLNQDIKKMADQFEEMENISKELSVNILESAKESVKMFQTIKKLSKGYRSISNREPRKSTSTGIKGQEAINKMLDQYNILADQSFVLSEKFKNMSTKLKTMLHETSDSCNEISERCTEISIKFRKDSNKYKNRISELN